MSSALNFSPRIMTTVALAVLQASRSLGLRLIAKSRVRMTQLREAIEGIHASSRASGAK
jgi:hypothetical protein